MTPDPFWQRTGFWAALMATVPLVFALLNGTVSPELVAATIGAWGAFATGAKIRKSVNVRTVDKQNEWVIGQMRHQAEHIHRLESLNGMGGPSRDGTAEDGAPA